MLLVRTPLTNGISSRSLVFLNRVLGGLRTTSASTQPGQTCSRQRHSMAVHQIGILSAWPGRKQPGRVSSQAKGRTNSPSHAGKGHPPLKTGFLTQRRGPSTFKDRFPHPGKQEQPATRNFTGTISKQGTQPLAVPSHPSANLRNAETLRKGQIHQLTHLQPGRPTTKPQTRSRHYQGHTLQPPAQGGRTTIGTSTFPIARGTKRAQKPTSLRHHRARQ